MTTTEVTELVEQAVLANSAGRPAHAEELLGRALGGLPVDRGDDEEEMLRGRAMITLALARFERGGHDTAIALLREARAHARGVHREAIQALADIQRAGLLGRSGEWAEVLRVLDRIDPTSEHVSARAGCVVLLNRGLAEQFLGELDGSHADLQAAATLARQHGLADLLGSATHNLGRLELLRGNIPRALELMASALAGTGGTSEPEAAVDYARACIEVGLLDEAKEILSQAESSAKAAGLTRARGEIAMEAARRDLLAGDYRAASVHARAAARVFDHVSADAWRTQAELLAVEAQLARGGGTEEAVAALVAAAPRAEAAGVGTEATMLTAEALALSGRLDEARDRLGTLGGPRNLSFTNRLHLALTRATVSNAAGDLQGARGVLRRAATCLADEQARYAGLDNRTALALHGRRLAAIDLDLALRSGSAHAVFAATERWRGTSNRLDPVSPSGDAVLDGLLAELRRARLEQRDADGERGQTLRREIARLERSAAHRDWETASTDERPRPAANRHTARRPVTYPEIRAALADSGTGLVALFVHGGRLRAVTIDADRSAVVDLAPEDAVIELVRRTTADLTTIGRVGVPALRDAVDRSLTTTMSRLDAVLAAAYPRTDRIVILPSRLLASLPWRLLPGVGGRPLVVAPSATFWAGTGRYAAGSPPIEGGVVALAGPDLARAGEEAASVAATWGGSVATGDEATGDALTAALRDRRIVHIAAHGTHHDQSPLFSHIHLADGPVFAHEFQRVGVGAEHVVLSACDVGRAHVRHGEEALGLTSSLLASGVRNVVASVAPVRDEQAEAVMTAYHVELARGTDASLALERAAAGIPDGRLFCAYGTDWAPTLR